MAFAREQEGRIKPLLIPDVESGDKDAAGVFNFPAKRDRVGLVGFGPKSLFEATNDAAFVRDVPDFSRLKVNSDAKLDGIWGRGFLMERKIDGRVGDRIARGNLEAKPVGALAD
jgi:hypothetical protein